LEDGFRRIRGLCGEEENRNVFWAKGSNLKEGDRIVSVDADRKVVLNGLQRNSEIRPQCVQHAVELLVCRT
jgi:hypothetical protein